MYCKCHTVKCLNAFAAAAPLLQTYTHADKRMWLVVAFTLQALGCGCRLLVQDALPAFRAQNPQLAVEEVVRRHRHPMLVALYRERDGARAQRTHTHMHALRRMQRSRPNRTHAPCQREGALAQL